MSVVVVGFDGSDDALHAVRWAADEARLRSVRLRIVHAWSYLAQPGGFDPSYGEDDARKVLDDGVAGLGDALAGVEIEPVTVCELPARALLDSAGDADMLVVGARGAGGFKGMLLGSVSQQVAHRATCPVVIIPGPARAAG